MRVLLLSCAFVFTLLIFAAQAHANQLLGPLDWRSLLEVDSGSAMNEIQRVAQDYGRYFIERDDSQEVFDSIFAVYKAARQLERSFPYDASRDQNLEFYIPYTPAGQPVYVDWAQLQLANVRTAIGVLWDTARRTGTAPGEYLSQLKLFLQLSHRYFQMKQ